MVSLGKVKVSSDKVKRVSDLVTTIQNLIVLTREVDKRVHPIIAIGSCFILEVMGELYSEVSVSLLLLQKGFYVSHCFSPFDAQLKGASIQSNNVWQTNTCHIIGEAG